MTTDGMLREARQIGGSLFLVNSSSLPRFAKSSEIRPRNFEDFSFSGADISGTRGHMTKPRKTWSQNTLFFHASEGFCQGINVWIEKIPYPLYLGVLESHTLISFFESKAELADAPWHNFIGKYIF